MKASPHEAKAPRSRVDEKGRRERCGANVLVVDEDIDSSKRCGDRDDTHVSFERCAPTRCLTPVLVSDQIAASFHIAVDQRDRSSAPAEPSLARGHVPEKARIVGDVERPPEACQRTGEIPVRVLTARPFIGPARLAGECFGERRCRGRLSPRVDGRARLLDCAHRRQSTPWASVSLSGNELPQIPNFRHEASLSCRFHTCFGQVSIGRPRATFEAR